MKITNRIALFTGVAILLGCDGEGQLRLVHAHSLC
jgi:hypothetical protein